MFDDNDVNAKKPTEDTFEDVSPFSNALLLKIIAFWIVIAAIGGFMLIKAILGIQNNDFAFVFFFIVFLFSALTVYFAFRDAMNIPEAKHRSSPDMAADYLSQIRWQNERVYRKNRSDAYAPAWKYKPIFNRQDLPLATQLIIAILFIAGIVLVTVINLFVQPEWLKNIVFLIAVPVLILVYLISKDKADK